MAHAVDLLRSVEQLKDDLPTVRIGDNVKVHVLVDVPNRSLSISLGLLPSCDMPSEFLYFSKLDVSIDP